MFGTIKKINKPIIETCVKLKCKYPDYKILHKEEVLLSINNLPISICDKCCKFIYKKQ